MSTALWTSGQVHWTDAALALLGALSAYISVNVFNEYIDFKTGLDLVTRRTPFSGGSGTLPANPEMTEFALLTARGTFFGERSSYNPPYWWASVFSLAPDEIDHHSVLIRPATTRIRFFRFHFHVGKRFAEFLDM